MCFYECCCCVAVVVVVVAVVGVFLPFFLSVNTHFFSKKF